MQQYGIDLIVNELKDKKNWMHVLEPIVRRNIKILYELLYLKYVKLTIINIVLSIKT